MIQRLKKILFPELTVKLVPYNGTLEKMGSGYGSWTVPTSLLSPQSVCYLAGAGEDISFDTILASRIKCPVQIFDPTPKARLHFEQLKEAVGNGQQMIINNTPGRFYTIDKASLELLHFNETGIWTRNDTLKFFAPQNEEHVSHSIHNLQETANYFEARVMSLSAIMEQFHHPRIDLLKLDIEGAEFEVIDAMLEQNIPINILCVEFHRTKEGGLNPTKDAIKKLIAHGYMPVAREELDFTFIHNKALV